MSAGIDLENVCCDFGTFRAVDHVSVSIQPGEFFSFLGPSGCGKTTILRMISGFTEPTQGTIRIGGKDMQGQRPNQRPTALIFQNLALFPLMPVWENIAFGLRRQAMPKDKLTARVEAMLKLVQLGKFAQRKPHQLSGGQQQRVALARSLARQPQLLLLDEPLGALDKKLREQTQLEVVNILEQVGLTCVMVTHDQQEAMTMSSRIAVMSEGKFLQIGSPSEIYETPNCRFVADFIGDCNMFNGTLIVDEPDHVVVETPECKHYVGHGITGTLGMDVSVAVRPEKIVVSKTKPAGEHNFCQGEVVDLAYLGSYTTYHLKLNSGMKLKASAPNVDRHQEGVPTWGDKVFASWSESAMVVLTS